MPLLSAVLLLSQIARTATKDKILKQDMADMKKLEPALKPGDTSDNDDHLEEDEEKEDTGNSSNVSVEENYPKDMTRSSMTNPTGGFTDSDCCNSKGYSKQGKFLKVHKILQLVLLQACDIFIMAYILHKDYCHL